MGGGRRVSGLESGEGGGWGAGRAGHRHILHNQEKAQAAEQGEEHGAFIGGGAHDVYVSGFSAILVWVFHG